MSENVKEMDAEYARYKEQVVNLHSQYLTDLKQAIAERKLMKLEDEEKPGRKLFVSMRTQHEEEIEKERVRHKAICRSLENSDTRAESLKRSRIAEEEFYSFERGEGNAHAEWLSRVEECGGIALYTERLEHLIDLVEKVDGGRAARYYMKLVVPMSMEEVQETIATSEIEWEAMKILI